MTYVEWRDSPMRTTSKNGPEDEEKLSKMWAKYDTAGVGYLTERETVLRTA
jgi:hypothetical protein